MTWILSKINVEYIIGRVGRDEQPELPEEAIREAVVNAVAHRDYRSTANIQICLFSDRLEITSPGGLPAGMTESDLGIKSIPRNPLLFSMLHRMEVVERIGSGIRRIRDLCHTQGIPVPIINVSESWVSTIFIRPRGMASGRAESEPESPLSGTKLGLSRDQVTILHICLKEQTIGGLMQTIGRSNRTKFRDQVLKPLMQAGWLEMTIPEKPRSSKQKYRLTSKGKQFVAENSTKP